MAEVIQDQYQISTLIRHIGQLVTVAQHTLPGASGALQVLENAALAVHEGKIVWIGSDGAVEQLFQGLLSEQDITTIDAHNAIITPGLVDSHTHLVFAGDRVGEFHLRRDGKSYGDLLAQGRGNITTVQATREAAPEALLELALARLAAIRSYGTTTVEIKTGYGLELAAEERCLRIINQLNMQQQSQHGHIRVVPTFLGAHSVPLEYRTNRTVYIDLVVEQMLPRFSGLARFCDVYCE